LIVIRVPGAPFLARSLREKWGFRQSEVEADLGEPRGAEPALSKRSAPNGSFCERNNRAFGSLPLRLASKTLQLIVCHPDPTALRCLTMPGLTLPRATKPLTISKGVSANLDFLRAIAVLLVLTQHLCRRMHVEHLAWIPTTSLGLFGVLLFFVHTSLVLMYSMDRSGLHGAPLFKDFYIRRIFRIYPLSILAVAAAVALHLNSDINGIAGLSHGPLPGKLAILSQFLLVQNLVHVKSIVNVLWSLPFEVQMYLFLPFLFVWVKRRWAQHKPVFWPLLGLWAVSLASAWSQPNFSILGRASLLLFVPCFLPGIIAFAGPRVPRLRSYLWPIFILGLVCAFSLYPVLPMGWLLCLILGVLIPFFREIQSRSIRFISHRIATYSYGIYISHQFCIWFALGVLMAQPLWLRLAVLSSSLVLVPILLYHGVEKPMILAGIRLATRLRDKPTAPMVVAA
jgi:peptidoglycan/LPS O-acetylase OafA/YrhL